MTRGRARQWLRVRLSNAGAVPIIVDLQTKSQVGPAPQPAQMQLSAAPTTPPAVQEYRDVIQRDRICATVQGGAPGLVCRFFVVAPDGATSEIVAEDRTGRVCSYAFGDRPFGACPARREESITPSEFSDLINDMAQSPALARLRKAQLAALPAGVLLAVSEIARDPDSSRNGAEALGAPAADLAADFLRRPQEYALLRDPAVRAFYLAAGAGPLRCVPDLVLSRTGGPTTAFTVPQPLPGPLEQMFPRPGSLGGDSGRCPPTPTGPRDYLLSAGDTELDAWMGGLIAGLDWDDLFELLAVRRWRCPPTELVELALRLRRLRSDPLSALLGELLTAPNDSLWREVDVAVKAEDAALRGRAGPPVVRAAAEARTRALRAAAARLERVAGAERAGEVASVAADLREGLAAKAVRGLGASCPSGNAPAGTIAEGMVFRAEVAWAAEERARPRRGTPPSTPPPRRGEAPNWPPPTGAGRAAAPGNPGLAFPGVRRGRGHPPRPCGRRMGAMAAAQPGAHAAARLSGGLQRGVRRMPGACARPCPKGALRASWRSSRARLSPWATGWRCAPRGSAYGGSSHTA